MSEEFFVKLAGIRKVRTPGGSQYFGLPIGAPITADAILKAKKRHAALKGGTASVTGNSGGSTASGGTPQSSKPIKTKKTPAGLVADTGAPAGTTAAQNQAASKKSQKSDGAAVVSAKAKATVQNSSLTGPKRFKIGEVEFNVPVGSRLFRSKSHADRAFLIDDEGKGHVFNDKGEVKFPDVYMEALASKLSGDLKDTDYVADVFENDETDSDSEEGMNLSEAEPGQVLRDSEMVPQFTKQDDGTWKHTELDIDLTDEQLQPLVDSGELQATTPEQDDDLQDILVPKEIAFSKFKDSATFQAELDRYESGDQIVLDMGEDATPEILTKGDDGKWNGPKGIALKPSNMYPFKDKLSGISPEGQKGEQEKLNLDDVEADDVPDLVEEPTDVTPESSDSKTPSATGTSDATSPATVPEESVSPTPQDYDAIGNDLSKALNAPEGQHAARINADGAVEIFKKEGNSWKSETGIDWESTAFTSKNSKFGDKTYLVTPEQAESLQKFMATYEKPETSTAGTYESLSESTPIKIGDLAPGMMVDGGEIMSVEQSSSYKGKIDVTYKSKFGGKIKKGTWWKHNNITIHPKDKPAIVETEESAVKGIPNSKTFDAPNFDDLKKGDYLFFKKGDSYEAFERTGANSWFQRDGDPLDPSNDLAVSKTSLGMATYMYGNDKFVTDADGLEAIRTHNAETKKKKFYALVSEGLTDGELDEAEAGQVVKVTHDENKSPAMFIKTDQNFWMDKNGVLTNTSEITEGKKEFVDSEEESKDFSNMLEETQGSKTPWMSVEQPSPEEDAYNAMLQHISEVEALAPSEPKGVKNFFSDGKSNPPLIADGWKEFSPEDIVHVKVGEFVKAFKNGPSKDEMVLERVPGGWKDEYDGTWSSGELLTTAPKSTYTYYHATENIDAKDPVTSAGIPKSKTLSEGSTIEDATLESVQSLPSNISVSAGGKKFISGPDGWVNSATGAPMTADDITGPVTVDSIIPEDAKGFSKADGTDVSPGTPLTTEADFNDLPVGAHVEMGNDDAEGMVFNKTGSNSYEADGLDGPIPQDVLVDNLNDGIPATFVGTSDSSNEVEPMLDWEKELLGVPYGTLGTYKKSEISEAVNALEEHSGFQIAYGLKSVPNNRIAKNQAALKELAQKEFPELKPKPAFIAYLKKYGSIQESAAPIQKNSSKKTVKLGSVEPKKVGVQGWDGGEFSTEDIQDAINILEEFQGKNFKAELNKKGNPLGTLDPNAIVGFNKDKTVTKQKLIDHLNGSLGDEDPVADIEDSGDQSVVDAVSTIVDANKEATPEKAQEFLNTAQYLSPPPPPLDKSKSSTEKKADNAAILAKAEYAKKAYKSIAEGNPVAVGEDDWSSIPLHSKIQPTDTSYPWTKKLTGGMWVTSDGTYMDDKTVQGTNDTLKYKIVEIPDIWGLEKDDLKNVTTDATPVVPEQYDVENIDPVSDTIDDVSPDIDSLKPGDTLTQSQMSEAKVGTVIASQNAVDKSLYSYTKQENGKWKPANGEAISSEFFDKITMEVQFVPDEKVEPNFSTSDYVMNKVTMLDIETSAEGDTLWDIDGARYTKLPTSQWEKTSPGMPKGYLTTVDMTYSLQSKGLFREKPQKVPASDLAGFPTGTALKNLNSPATHLVKHDDSWYVHMDTGEKSHPAPDSLLEASANEGTLYMYKTVTDELNAPEVTPAEKNKVSPGKYTTTGKVFMYVNADGSGVYEDKNGGHKKLSPNAVQKNYDGGMSKYLGSESAPKMDETNLSKPAPKKSKTAATIPDGEYYLGIATSGKGTKIIVKDGAYTQLKSPTGLKATPGQQIPNSDWFKSSGDGASFKWRKYKYDTASYVTKTFTKKDGNWTEDGTGNAPEDENLLSWQGTVISNGYGDPKPSAKTALETKFSQGQLLDQYGTTVMPENYSGSVMFLGGGTTGAQLADLVKGTTSPETDWSATALKNKGLLLDNSTAVAFLTAQGVVITDYAQKKTMGTYFHKLAQDMTDGLVVEEHDSNAAELFEFDALGNAEMSLELAANPINWNSSVSEATAWVKQASLDYGDGKVIGLHLTKKSEKVNWAGEFAAGNFDKMYKIEVAAAAEKGIPHAAGWKHPGYPGNADTNKITWAAAVKGEIPAGQKIDGEWTTLGTSHWSIPELDNYLIKAQMQNPQHLSTSEKRLWVRDHTNGNKSGTDLLSARAALRAKKGDAPLSSDPAWTEGIVPAKAYDYLFDNKTNPTSGDWNNANISATHDWLKDNKELPELVAYWKTIGAKSLGYSDPIPELSETSLSGYRARELVGGFFDKREADYQAELLKPVYHLKKKMQGGQGETWLAEDQFDRLVVFKPADHEKKGPEALYRVEVEVSGNKLGRSAGFLLPEANVGVIGENTGAIQKFLANNGDLEGKNLTEFTNKQLGQIAGHQVLDHFLQNDDTHQRNLMIGENGDIIGIDKGRAFLAYGTYEGLAADPKNSNMSYNMLSKDTLVYADLIGRMRSGDFTPEQATEAYVGAMKAAKRIQRMNDASVANMVREGTNNRTKWGYKDYHYFASTETLGNVPNNQDELVERVLEAKASMPQQVQDMYDAVFKAAGWDAPEMPKKAIDGHTSGWQEETAITNAFEAKVYGAAALHGSAQIAGGSSLIWTEKSKDGDDVVKGKFNVGAIVGKEMSSKLLSFANAGTVSEDSDGLNQFPDMKSVSTTFVKTVYDIADNFHLASDNKKFDAKLQADYDLAVASLDEDLEYFSADLLDREDTIIFPSGTSVPGKYVSQYNMALMHYKRQADRIDKAKKEDGVLEAYTFNAFYVSPLNAQFITYSNPTTGEQYKQLHDSKYVYANPENGFETAIVNDLPDGVKNLTNGWGKKGPSTATSPIQVKKVSAYLDSGTLTQDGVYTLDGNQAQSGQQGYQWDITLPTGELISFRDTVNSYAVSQHNRVNFKLSGEDKNTSLARVEEYLETLGLDMSGTDDAETLYWRSMFHTVVARDGGGVKVSAARDEIMSKARDGAKNLGLNDDDVTIHSTAEIIQKAFPTEEAEFYRNLADKVWGSSKVTEFISNNRHLPKYQHMNLNDGGKADTGHAYWERIDVDIAEMKESGTLLAIAASGKDDAILKYITSGGMLSTENRLRMVPHHGASQSDDQSSGGANYVFARVAKGGHETGKMGNLGSNKSSHVVYLSPEVLAQTDTFGFSSDNYGNTSKMANSPYSADKILNFSGNDNEVMIKDSLSILDFIEVMVFNDEEKRNEAIQRMKALGWEKIRGLPVEDRLVMRNTLKTSLSKVKAAWNQPEN